MLKKLNPYRSGPEYMDEVQQLRIELEDLKHRFSSLSHSLEVSIGQSNYNPTAGFILIHLNKIILRIPVADILMMEALDNYTMIHLKDGVKHLTCKTLQYWDAEVYRYKNLFRTHRSYTVNLDYLLSMDTEASEIILTNGIRIKYARTKKKEILDWLQGRQNNEKLINFN